MTAAEGDGSGIRDSAARARDEIATQRDRIADVRDRLAEIHENGIDDADYAATAQRAAAALDREHARIDRRLAAADRAHAAAARSAAGVDELTGALRRGVGLAAVEREIERAHRTNATLVLAFVAVDGLKRVNDTAGHAAGDRLLRRTAELMATHLRPYDLVVRVGATSSSARCTGSPWTGSPSGSSSSRRTCARLPRRVRSASGWPT